MTDLLHRNRPPGAPPPPSGADGEPEWLHGRSGYPLRMAAGFCRPALTEVETMRGRALACADGYVVRLWGRPFLALRADAPPHPNTTELT